METSAAKRRKTSPRTAVSIGVNNGEPATIDATVSRSTKTAKRASFASPTKASLSRHNPQILERRQSAAPTPVDEQATASRPGSRDSNESLSALLTAQLEDSLEGSVTQSQPVRKKTDSSGAHRGPGRPRRSPMKPVTRPFPPPAPEGEDEITDPFRGRELRRSRGASTAIIQETTEDPELPPTPTQLGIDDPIVTTPPSGIHRSSSPSRRARRGKIAAGILKSSPLKKPPLRPPQKEVKGQAKKKTDRSSKFHAPRASHDEGLSKSDRDNAQMQITIHQARGIRPLDQYQKKRDLLRVLETEAALLEADLEFATAENERIRKQLLGQPNPEASDHETLLSLLTSHLLPPEKAKPPDATKSLVQAALNPSMWLPFGAKSGPPPIAAKDAEPLPQPASHHPILMTTDEERPFLQAFTPLSFTSTSLVLPRQSTDDPILQQHDIMVSSPDTPGLFTAKIGMTVDTQNLKIMDLSVPKLDPAAEPELGPFIHGVLHERVNRALAQNVTIITWAMGEWYRVATKRATFWCLLMKEIGESDRLREKIAKMRTRQRKRAHAADEDAVGSVKEGGRPSVVDILAHLGRTSFETPISVGDEEVKVRVQWHIGFDWTGEAQSKASLMVGMPGKWHEVDERKSLGGVSKMFDELVQGTDDVLGSVATIVALVAGVDGR